MRIKTTCKIAILVFYLIISHNVCVAFEKLNMQSDIDTAYLPYYSTEFWWLPTNTKNAYPINDRMMVISPGIQNLIKGEILIADNVAMSSDGSSRFVPRTFPGQKTGDDDPIRYTITTCKVLKNILDSNEYVVGVCHNSDSIFAFKLNLNTDAITYKFLYNKKKLKKLTPHAYVLNIEDYDYDGDKDILLYVGNQKHLRRLFQFGFNKFDLKWSIEVSSSFIPNNFIVCKDSINPNMIFVTGNPGNGMNDKNYEDWKAYFSIVNSKGEIINNKIVGRYSYEGSQLVFNENDSTFFLKHFDDFIEPNQFKLENIPNTYLISKINNKGEVIKKLPIGIARVGMWMMRYGESNQLYLFVRYNSDKIEVYDSDLNLKFVGDSVNSLEYFSRIKIEHESDSVYVFSDGLYDTDLTKILQFPFNSSYFFPVEYDTLGNLTAFAISNADTISIRYFKKKRFIELLSVFYHRSQMYILMILSGLIVGLVMVNFYRSKNRKNLTLILNQKRELEDTHKALRKAQATIISQEKFQQAKDIAGGFAHEIRNSLFPARSALSKMSYVSKDKLTDEKWIKKISRFADDSVERAISITQLISQYTSLESNENIERVDINVLLNSVLNDNSLTFESKKIKVIFNSSNCDLVYGNKEQFYIVLNNLVLNAIDALEKTDAPELTLQTKQKNNEIIVNIIDNGVGINVNNMDKLFDVFFSTKPSSGSGLGLAIVKKILELYDSNITVASEYKHGCTFTLHFRTFATKDISYGK